MDQQLIIGIVVGFIIGFVVTDWFNLNYLNK